MSHWSICAFLGRRAQDGAQQVIIFLACAALHFRKITDRFSSLLKHCVTPFWKNYLGKLKGRALHLLPPVIVRAALYQHLGQTAEAPL